MTTMTTMTSMSKRSIIGIALLVALVLAAVIARLLIGRDPIAGGINFGWPVREILVLRFGAVQSALVAGASLGLSGLLLQALLRNPLASPFILGLSAGAGLGATAALWILTASGAAAAPWMLIAVSGADGVIPGTIGSLGVLILVYALGRRGGRLDPLTLVLAGTVVATLCGACILLVQSLMPPASRGDSWMWFMGQVPEMPSRGTLFTAIVVLSIAFAASVRSAAALDVASTSDDEAESLGVSLRTLRVMLFVCAGTLASASVALCGPIAFVGFVAPHIARVVLGARHTALVPASLLAGAAVLVWADAIRQSIDIGAGRLPIGVLTALIGGPIFLIVLRSGRSRSGEWRC